MTTDVREGTTAGVRVDVAPHEAAVRLRAFGLAVVVSLALWALIAWGVAQLL